MKTFHEFLQEAAEKRTYTATIKNKSGAGTPVVKTFTDIAKALKYIKQNNDASPGVLDIRLTSKSDTSDVAVSIDWQKKLRFH